MQLYPNSKNLALAGLGFLSLSLVANAQAPKSDYTCAGNPNDDGATYTTYGVTFQLMCARATLAQALDSVPAATLKECADKCALHQECQTADWNNGMCHRKKEYIPTHGGVFDTWFPTQKREPRTCPADTNRLPAPKPNPDVVDSPTCEKDDGNMFTTDDGAYWTLLCCTENADGSFIPGSESVEGSLKDCAAKCSTTKGCQSYEFANQLSDPSYGNCKLYSTGGFSTKKSVDTMHDYAYVTAPPAVSSPDTLTTACPTECPDIDGREYKSQGGELFHMDCVKRHGTQVINEELQPTLKECIDSCSKYIPCHSVDYHASSKKCYFGQHHGNPTIDAPGFQSAYSLGCAGACEDGCCGTGNNGGSSSTP